MKKILLGNRRTWIAMRVDVDVKTHACGTKRQYNIFRPHNDTEKTLFPQKKSSNYVSPNINIDFVW